MEVFLQLKCKKSAKKTCKKVDLKLTCKNNAKNIADSKKVFFDMQKIVKKIFYVFCMQKQVQKYFAPHAKKVQKTILHVFDIKIKGKKHL